MECLAAVFVISIGLLGVLAVIPYGSYQIAKARKAEHTAWAVVSAIEDVQAMGLAKPLYWKSGNSYGTIFTYDDDDDNKVLNPAGYFLMVDPHPLKDEGMVKDDSILPVVSSHVYRIGCTTGPDSETAKFDIFGIKKRFKETMTGQDDLDYTTYAEGKRPDFEGQDNRQRSSGKYTWFFTFKPRILAGEWTTGSSTAVDIIGCYNRGGEKVISVYASAVTPTLNGLMVTLNGMPTGIEMKTVKQVLLTWGSSPSIDGAWYEVINVLNTESTTPTLVLRGTGYDTSYGDLEILFIEGTVYHKPIQVDIK